MQFCRGACDILFLGHGHKIAKMPEFHGPEHTFRAW